MKAFITGISGFVGTYLSELLEKKGYEVSGIDRVAAYRKKYEIFQCDLLDKPLLSDILSQVQPDVIFHLAGFSNVSKSFDQPEEAMQINVEGTRNLFEAMMDHNLQSTVLVVSSLQVYGPAKKMPITEETKLKPNSPYAKSKVEQEKVCQEYTKKGLNIIISRSFNHTGPGQPPEYVVPGFAKQVADIEKGAQKVINVGNIELERDFTDVRDMVNAYVLAVERCRPGIYNICQGKPVKLSYILDVLKKNSKTKIEIVVDQSRFRKNDPAQLYGDASKFKAATKWEPQISFDKTILDTLEYFRE